MGQTYFVSYKTLSACELRFCGVLCSADTIQSPAAAFWSIEHVCLFSLVNLCKRRKVQVMKAGEW